MGASIAMHVRIVFSMVLFIYLICAAITVTAFKVNKIYLLFFKTLSCFPYQSIISPGNLLYLLIKLECYQFHVVIGPGGTHLGKGRVC